MIDQLVRLVARLGLFCGLALPVAGWACSPPADYRVPTNFELVQHADLIVLALVIAGPELPATEGKPVDQTVQIAPMQVLKGVLPAQPVSLSGRVSGERGDYEAAPTPLTAAHYSVRSGRCTRQIYAKGNLVLAMFEKTGDGFRPIAAPLARAVEDVESFDSLWVRTARLYVAMQQQATGDALREAVIARRDRLRARSSDMEAQAVAADLQAWLEPPGRLAPAPAPAEWSYFDGQDELSLSAAGPVSLTCRRDGRAIELEANRPRKPGSISLVAGARSFPAQDLRPASASRGFAGSIPLTPELDRLLKQSAGPFAVAVDATQIRGRRPSDMFQKFAMRCETLLRP